MPFRIHHRYSSLEGVLRSDAEATLRHLEGERYVCVTHHLFSAQVAIEGYERLRGPLDPGDRALLRPPPLDEADLSHLSPAASP